MRCSSCQAPMSENASFCGSCGARVEPVPPSGEPAPTCPACGGGLAAGIRFCGACGEAVPSRLTAAAAPQGASSLAAPTTPADPQAVGKYAAELRGLITGGVLVQDALDMLAHLRRDHGVTAAQHRALVEEIGCFEGLPVALALDPESAYLVERQPTTLILAAENLRRDPLDLVRALEVQYRCSTSGLLHHVGLGLLGPGKRQPFAVPLDPPESAGQYQLEGFLSATFRNGAVFRGRFQLPALRAVARLEGQSGPSHVSITVDAHNAALVKDIGQFAPAATTQGTGEVRGASGRWNPIAFTAASEDEIDCWLISRPASGGAATATPILGEPLPCRGALLRLKRESTRSPGGDPRDVWLLRDDDVSFGRDDARADLRLAVEPFDPPARHPQNVQQSMRISSRHLAFQRSDAGVFVRDLGTSNGTLLDGRRLLPNQPQPLGQRAILRVADALGLEALTILGDDGLVHALHVLRTDNEPQRSYLLASGGVGLWPSDRRLFGPRQRGGQAAPILVLWQGGGPCVRNLGQPGVTVNGARLGVGQTQALDQHHILRLGTTWVIAVINILAERYHG